MGRSSSKMMIQASIPPTILRNGWLTKASVSNQGGILLVMCCIFTAHTIVRYFMDEEEAHAFVKYMLEQRENDSR